MNNINIEYIKIINYIKYRKKIFLKKQKKIRNEKELLELLDKYKNFLNIKENKEKK